MASSLFKILILRFVFCAHGARLTSMDEDAYVFAKSADEEPPVLCDTELVEEACLILNGGEKHARGDDWTNSELLKTILSSTDHAMSAFWEAASLPAVHEMSDGLGYWVTCEELCAVVVDYGREHGVMPATSDVACYNVGMETKCDLPMSPSSFPGFGPKPDEDMPDFHDTEMLQNVSKKMALIQAQAALENSTTSLVSTAQELGAEDVDYDIWEMSERVANFFRIYPTKKPEPEEGNADGSSLAETSSWPYGKYELHQQKAAQSKAYISIVIRAFNLKKTQRQMSTWFGSRAFSSSTSRREILRVLNSVDHMISNVEPVYEGPQCSPNTYAYVYPKAYTCSRSSELKSSACTKYNGKFVFYLCALYLNRPNEMIETLVHEGSHHATAYTDDVSFEGGTAYGRSVCQRLASRQPSSAIKNADNFCYYIQDVATQVSVDGGSSGGSSAGGSSGGSSSGSSSRCFTGTRRSTPDSEGDCTCRSGYTCYKRGSAGCPWSRGSRSYSYGSASCSDCMCHSR